MADNVFDKHQRKIAEDTLKMPDAMLGVMGGPSKAEAEKWLREHPKTKDGGNR